MSLRRVLVLMVLGLLATGCAAPLHRPYDPAVRHQIRTIGLLTPAVSDEVAVRMEVHPGESFGVVGMLVAAGDMSGKSGEFMRATRSKGFVCSNAFQQQLDEGLRAAGYVVHSITVTRSPYEHDFLDHYPPADGSVDAYLDLYTDLIGYTAAGGATPYRPTVHLNVRLVRATDHKVLYQDRIAYNAFGDGDGAITLAPADGYEFARFEQLVADPVKALEGLRLAMRATGEALARQLR
ncbi:MAG: hypothetical protein ACREUE_01535 [Panacagrimonas sp.]